MNFINLILCSFEKRQFVKTFLSKQTTKQITFLLINSWRIDRKKRESLTNG
jgi:hypothetical protein